MKQIVLGKKIKDLRLEKKMTQAELAGDTITRNMLSQIENGVAQPSVSTIIELSEKLDVPTEYFFSESGDLDSFRKIGAISKIRKLFAAGEYGKCLSRLDALGVSDDETEYLFARANFERGISYYREGLLAGACEYFRAAIEHANKTVYADKDFCVLAKQYLCAACFVRSQTPEDEELDCMTLREMDLKADLAYVGAMAGNVIVYDYGEENAVYAEHLALRREMNQSGDWNAEDMMHRLRDILSRAEESRYAVLKYYVLCDLETLAERTGDYKCAYECSSARLALSEKMNH